MMINTRTRAIASYAFYPIFVISLGALFLFYKYILQIFPGVITDQLMKEFQLTGAGFGNLAATFYYTYMFSQLVAGVLLDRYSTRWLTSTAIFSCALGVFLFSMSHSLLAAELSRGLMGLGVAFATVAYMKLAAMWFPPRQYAFVSGWCGTAAMLGAVFGQAALAWILRDVDWRHCLYVTGLLGFLLAFTFAFVVRDRSEHLRHLTETKKPHSFKKVLEIFKNKKNWILTMYSGLAFSPVAIFGGLWGNPFLEQAYQLSKTQAASMISLVFIGFAIGSPILGFISDRFGVRRNLMLLCTFISCIAVTLVLFFHPMPVAVLSLLLFIFGFGLGSYMLVFTMAKELNCVGVIASVIVMINTGDAVLDAVTEPFIGKLLDYFWNGDIVNGVHYFSLHSYHLALSVLPIFLIASCLLLLWVRDTKA